MSQDTVPIDPEKFHLIRNGHGKSAKISQYVLAQRSGLSRSYISDIERGRRQPRPLAARSLAEALGVTIEDLI